MSLDWSVIAQSVIAGILVSWPVFIAGLWLSHRKIRAHVDTVTGDQAERLDKVTAQQTQKLEKITDLQTGILLHRLGPGYQGHEHRDGT